MIQIKKKIYFISKVVLSIIIFLTLILFFYSAFFYKSASLNKIEVKKQIEKEKLKLEEEIQNEIIEIKEKKEVKAKPEKTKIKKIKTEIKDGLYATVGNKVITKSDILNEIKVILILNNMAFTEDKKEKLQEMAIKSAVKRTKFFGI